MYSYLFYMCVLSLSFLAVLQDQWTTQERIEEKERKSYQNIPIPRRRRHSSKMGCRTLNKDAER